MFCSVGGPKLATELINGPGCSGATRLSIAGPGSCAGEGRIRSWPHAVLRGLFGDRTRHSMGCRHHPRPRVTNTSLRGRMPPVSRPSVRTTDALGCRCCRRLPQGRSAASQPLWSAAVVGVPPSVAERSGPTWLSHCLRYPSPLPSVGGQGARSVPNTCGDPAGGGAPSPLGLLVIMRPRPQRLDARRGLVPTSRSTCRPPAAWGHW